MKEKKRCRSIISVLEDTAAAIPYKLSKGEKKQIKRDLLEFSKKSQGLTKENLLRKNLIKTEEAKEAKICEGSAASSILKNHRIKEKKMIKIPK